MCGAGASLGINIMYLGILLTLKATVTINIVDNHLYIYTGTTYIADKQMNMHHSC
jgi:hypothetical protein